MGPAGWDVTSVIVAASAAIFAYALILTTSLYANWIKNHLAFALEAALIPGMIAGVIGQQFGLRNLFLNGTLGPQISAGISVALLVQWLFLLSFWLAANPGELGAEGLRCLSRAAGRYRLPSPPAPSSGPASPATATALDHFRAYLGAMSLPIVTGVAFTVAWTFAARTGTPGDHWVLDHIGFPLGIWLTLGITQLALAALSRYRPSRIAPFWRTWPAFVVVPAIFLVTASPVFTSG